MPTCSSELGRQRCASRAVPIGNPLFARVLQQDHARPRLQRHQVRAVADRRGAPASFADSAARNSLGGQAPQVSKPASGVRRGQRIGREVFPRPAARPAAGRIARRLGAPFERQPQPLGERGPLARRLVAERQDGVRERGAQIGMAGVPADLLQPRRPALAEGNHGRAQRPRQSQQQPAAARPSAPPRAKRRRWPRSRARGSRAAARDPRGRPAPAGCRRLRPPRRRRRSRSRDPRSRANRPPGATSVSAPTRSRREGRQRVERPHPDRRPFVSGQQRQRVPGGADLSPRAQPADPSVRRGHGKKHLRLVGRGVVRTQPVEQTRHGSRQRRNLGAEGGRQPQVRPRAMAAVAAEQVLELRRLAGERRGQRRLQRLVSKTFLSWAGGHGPAAYRGEGRPAVGIVGGLAIWAIRGPLLEHARRDGDPCFRPRTSGRIRVAGSVPCRRWANPSGCASGRVARAQCRMVAHRRARRDRRGAGPDRGRRRGGSAPRDRRRRAAVRRGRRRRGAGAPRSGDVALNKPLGCVTALRDPRHPTAYELLRGAPLFGELRPVGRLDLDTSGLLIWSTDGTEIQRLTHPKRAVPRTYQAALAGPFAPLPAKLVLDDGHEPQDQRARDAGARGGAPEPARSRPRQRRWRRSPSSAAPTTRSAGSSPRSAATCSASAVSASARSRCRAIWRPANTSCLPVGRSRDERSPRRAGRAGDPLEHRQRRADLSGRRRAASPGPPARVLARRKRGSPRRARLLGRG